MFRSCLPKTKKQAVSQFLSSRTEDEKKELIRLQPQGPRWNAYTAYLRMVYGLDEGNLALCGIGKAELPDAERTVTFILAQAILALRRRTHRKGSRSTDARLFRHNHSIAYCNRALTFLYEASQRFRSADVVTGIINVQHACANLDHAFFGMGLTPAEQISPDSIAGMLRAGSASPEWIVAWLCRRRGLPVVGIEILLYHVRSNNQCRDAFDLLATCYYELGMLREEQAVYERMIDLDIHTAETWNRLGVCFFDQKQYNNAISCYRKAIALRPNYALAYNNMGESYYRRGQMRRAMASYGISISLDSNFHEVHRLLGDIYRDLGMEAKFLQCYKRAAALMDKPAQEYLRKIRRSV